MSRDKKAGPVVETVSSSSSKTKFTGSESQAFSVSDFTTGSETVTTMIDGMMRTGKVFRCYQCFACKRHFPASKLSSALILCRTCLKASQAKGRTARLNVIDRITNDLRIFLRGRLEVR